jgi:hypothetical protein
MPITLTDDQLRAIQSGKATIEDFTQPQGGDPRALRSIKEDCIMMKNALAKIAEIQMSIIMKNGENYSRLSKQFKIFIVFNVLFFLMTIGTIMYMSY